MKRTQLLNKILKTRYGTILVILVTAFVAINALVSDYERYKTAKALIAETDGLFSVHYIDVGQGDATLLRSPNGEFMLIDCGTTESSDYLIKYLSDCGTKSLEYLIITHPHEDHYGGAMDVIESYAIENFIILDEFADTYPYDRLCAMLEMDTQIHEVQRNDTFTFADCADFRIISPAKADFDDYNDSSLALKIVFGNTAFLFTGDAEKEAERTMLAQHYDLSADVFKAGHHGSSTSNSESFIQAVYPEYAVISCGEDNDYGHPHKEVIERLNENGVRILSTAELSNIVFVSDGSKVTYTNDFNPDESVNMDSEKYGIWDYILSKLGV